jgi:hypothetical protein
MPRNVSIEEETPTSVYLKADLPGDLGGLPVTSWRVQYEAMKVESAEEFENQDVYDEGEKEVIFQEGQDISYIIISYL